MAELKKLKYSREFQTQTDSLEGKTIQRECDEDLNLRFEIRERFADLDSSKFGLKYLGSSFFDGCQLHKNKSGPNNTYEGFFYNPTSSYFLQFQTLIEGDVRTSNNLNYKSLVLIPRRDKDIKNGLCDLEKFLLENGFEKLE